MILKDTPPLSYAEATEVHDADAIAAMKQTVELMRKVWPEAVDWDCHVLEARAVDILNQYGDILETISLDRYEAEFFVEARPYEVAEIADVLAAELRLAVGHRAVVPPLSYAEATLKACGWLKITEGGYAGWYVHAHIYSEVNRALHLVFRASDALQIEWAARQDIRVEMLEVQTL